jgi:glutamate/tyrosine decarboxylase-like PLP-dependent enzyme
MTGKIVDKQLLNRALEHALGFLDRVEQRPVGAAAKREELLQALAGPLSNKGEAPSSVLDAIAAQADRGTLATVGPRFFGVVIGGSLPIALATDWLVSAWDQNAGIYISSPVSSVMEETAAAWILDLLGLPAASSVGFVTGGQMANFTCLAAARHAVLQRAGWNVEENGVNGAPTISLFTSAESHVTVDVALRLLGLGTRSVTRIAADAQGRMRPDALEAALEGAKGPIIVCAQAGNVSTGAFDPVPALADAVHARGGWLHVDGAFGLWARASRTLRPLTHGMEQADSWSTDAHKWLNVPYDCGVAVVKDSASHRGSMTSSAAYLEQTTGAERDPLDWAPEYSRRARGTPVYAALRSLGRDGLEAMLDRCCAQARQMAALLLQHPRVELLNEVVLNQVLVRFKPSKSTADELTREVVRQVQQEGTCWLAGSVWRGMAVMRISFSNWATTDEDVERSASAILSALERSV